MSEKKYKSEAWLREQYLVNGKSAPTIADEAGVSTNAIYDWMDRHGLDRDATRYGHKSRVNYATYYIDGQGYPRWQSKRRKKDGQRKTDNFHVHRLLAIAEFGVDAVVGMDVHHKNGVRWDNRPGNIELVAHDEHRAEHMTPDVVDMMIRSRGETPPARTDGGFQTKQQSIDGTGVEGQVTLDGDVVREGDDK